MSRACEHWIYKNPEVLASLIRGIEDAKVGRIVDVDIDFSQFIDEEDKENVQVRFTEKSTVQLL